MPKIVECVGLHLYSTATEQRDWELQIQALNFTFDPECEFRHDFAYQGNVDIDEWVQEQHETAEAFYLHADDFLHDDYDLEDHFHAYNLEG